MKKFKIKQNRGMTYVELIVVLSIFSVLSSVVIFNYGDFQAKVDIKNLASDVALKIVEAQKSSLNGVLPLAGYNPVTWKPSYGVYFDLSVPKQFIYFTDLNNSNTYDAGSELLDTINITKNNFISRIDKCSDTTCASPVSTNLFSIAFKRPDSSAIFTGLSVTGSEYVKITIASPKGIMALIKTYPSGRVQIGGFDTPLPTCTSWTYSSWGACQSNNTQTRTVLTSSPSGCTGGSPILSGSCTYTLTCTSWIYSSWGACQSNNTQTRTVLTSSPVGCTGGSPVLTGSCTYVPVCVPRAGSPTPTPTIDEDCNGVMDNTTSYSCNSYSCNPYNCNPVYGSGQNCGIFGCGGCVNGDNCTAACQGGGYGSVGWCAIPGSTNQGACCSCADSCPILYYNTCYDTCYNTCYTYY